MRNSITLCVFLVLTTGTTFAESGKINFTGEIIDTACVVDAGADNTINVTLGKVSAKEFTSAGVTAATTSFNINLKDCPEDTTATIRFEGLPKDGNEKILALTEEEEVASGVGIRLLRGGTKEVLPLNSDSGTYTIKEGVTELPFYAQYISTENTVSPGPANSVANFTLIYN